MTRKKRESMFIYQTQKKEQYYDKVIEMYRSTGYSSYRLTKIFPLSKHTIERWIANFAEENPQIESSHRMKKKVTQPAIPEPAEQLPASDVQVLQEELKRLRAELLDAQIKSEAYDELINVAEAKFGIQIRKKAGAKQ